MCRRLGGTTYFDFDAIRRAALSGPVPEAAHGAARGALPLESIMSLSVLTFSRVLSHFPVSISQASLPQWADVLRRTRKWVADSE